MACLNVLWNVRNASAYFEPSYLAPSTLLTLALLITTHSIRLSVVSDTRQIYPW